MSHTELADRIGVAQSTVTRWANGQSSPSLEHMWSSLHVTEARLAEATARAKRTRKVLKLVEQATQLASEYRVSRDPAVRQKWTRTLKRLADIGYAEE